MRCLRQLQTEALIRRVGVKLVLNPIIPLSKEKGI
jgi:hypothetical protein